MKKFIVSLIFSAVIIIFGANAASASSVNNFTIKNFDVEMRLGKDNNNRSTLTTIERITAVFPDYNQNHGLERQLVDDYDGHTTDLKLISITDGNGENIPYNQKGDTLRIGDPNRYVHGEQTYTITYSQHDITRNYTDTNSDEFYWDAIGNYWKVPINSAKVVLKVDDSISSELNDKSACYWGQAGSSDRCDMNGQDGHFEVELGNLSAGQGITIAVGFKSGTFSEYQMSLLEKLFIVWLIVQAVTLIAVIIISVIVCRWWKQKSDRKSEMGTIVAEYLPPKGYSVQISAKILGRNSSVTMTAQLIDLAVRHYIRIVEKSSKKRFGSAEYIIRIERSIDDLLEEERWIIEDMAGHKVSIGEEIDLSSLKNNVRYSSARSSKVAKLDNLIRGKYDLKHIDPSLKHSVKNLALWGLAVGFLLLSIPIILFAISMLIVSMFCYALTDKGLDLLRYLYGLKLYIDVAEIDRLKMLQSPDGAEKVGEIIDGKQSEQIIKLYERVLPYAVLFGQEKQWNKELGKYYESVGTEPDWYSGQGAFSAVMFMSAMNGFSSANNSYMSSSSSTGGSDGGGFSGGGGGGGGGGGW